MQMFLGVRDFFLLGEPLRTSVWEASVEQGANHLHLFIQPLQGLEKGLDQTLLCLACIAGGIPVGVTPVRLVVGLFKIPKNYGS